MPSPSPSLIGKKPAPKPAKEAPVAEPIRFYRVKEDRMVPRKGSGAFMLKRGKEISIPGGYTRKELDVAGVELVEIETPSWYLEQQATAREKHQEMLDAGHDVGPVPSAHVPTPVGKKAPAAAAEAPAS